MPHRVVPCAHFGRPENGELGLDEDDTAADVDPDRVRHDGAIGEQDAPDRHAVAGVRVRHQRDVADRERQVREVGRLLENAALEIGHPALDRDLAGLANPGEGGDIDGRRRYRGLGRLRGYDC
jgi:hypothetical protein